MFVCEDCGKKKLSESGQTWPWSKSYGPCELCKKVDHCNDVPSRVGWAWKHNEIKKPLKPDPPKIEVFREDQTKIKE